MSRPRGESLIHLNFDSLTDTITNLAGTLILVVVLVLGVSSPAMRLAGRMAHGRRSIEPLLQRAAQLQQETRQLGDEIRDQEGRLTRLRETIERLRKELRGRTPGQKAALGGRPSKQQPEQVVYRPPIEQFTRQQPIAFLCEEGRVSYLDLDALERQLKSLESSGKGVDGSGRPFAFDLADSDFRVRGSFRGTAKRLVAQMEVHRKPNRPGETWEEIQRPESRFQRELRRIGARNPSTCFVDFGVWPDSYETFRRARSLAWQAGYDVNWSAEQAGRALRLTRQPGPAVRIKQVH